MNRLSFFPVGENVSSSEEELKLFVTEEGVHLFDCPLLFNGIVHLGCGVPGVNLASPITCKMVQWMSESQMVPGGVGSK